MPGMFLKLFPLGLTGFDDLMRPTKLSSEAQENLFLDLPNHSFQHHHSYIFVALNIIQRRASHFQTHFTIHKLSFDAITKTLMSISPTILQTLMDLLQHKRKLGTLSSDEQAAMKLLNQVNTISAHIPGLQASKLFTHNEIQSYFSEFGLPHIYFTFYPSVMHSPIFQVIVSDHCVDLSDRFPFLVPSTEHALHLAQDPIATADFFEFCVFCVFKHLFGWDHPTHKSSTKGGILHL